MPNRRLGNRAYQELADHDRASVVISLNEATVLNSRRRSHANGRLRRFLTVPTYIGITMNAQVEIQFGIPPSS
jgi:hypothetical protein